MLFGAICSRTVRGRERLEQLLERLPFTAKTFYHLSLSRFMSALSTFTASGVDTDTAMQRSAEMVTHRGLSEKLLRCQQAMAGGRSLSQAIYEEKLFEPLYARMMISGAHSGSMEQVTSRLAELFSEDANGRLDHLIDGIEPALASFLTITVGFTLVSVMLPLIGILGSIG